MPQSLAQLLVHLVFSTKNRQRFLQDEEVRTELHKYIAGILRNLESPSIEINSVEDHVHVLFALSRKHALAKEIEEVKKSSSAWIKSKRSSLARFYWQSGYGAFSVSQSKVSEVRRYIKNQPGHHKRMSFQDELRGLFERHGMAFDERYVWD